VLAIEEGPSESIAVLERGNERRLMTNGFSMSGTAERSQRYMRLLVHFPLLQVPAPKDVLVVCFGVGNSAHAAVQHPVTRVDIVDLSESILGLSHLFTTTNGDVLHDPRVNVFVNDGRQHLRMSPPASYDLITSEPPPLTNAGVAALYSVEYYQLARSRLKPGGWMTQWLPIYQLREETALSVVRAFLDVFPAAILLSGWNNELVLAGFAGERIELDPDAITRAIGARPNVVADLEHIDLRTSGELLGTIVGPTSVLHQATAGAPPVTDDWPIMEYDSVLFAPIQRTPQSLYAPLALRENCPACFMEDQVRDDLKILAAFMMVHDAYLSSSDYLEPFSRSREHRYVPPRSSLLTDVLPQNAYLRQLARVR
jgi:spermidine synthase